MPRTMKQDAPEAFRLAVRKKRVLEDKTYDTVHYFGPYATAAAAKGQRTRAIYELSGWGGSTTFECSIERTVSNWEKIEDL